MNVKACKFSTTSGDDVNVKTYKCVHITLYGDVVSVKACRSLTNNLNGIERLSNALELCGGLRSFDIVKKW